MKKLFLGMLALAVLSVISLSMVSCGPSEPNLDMYTNSDYIFGTNTTVRGTLSGIVQDANSGAPISGATITLISYGEVFTTTSSSDGLYSFNDLHLGDYQVFVKAEDYAQRSFIGTISETPYVQTTGYTSIISEDLPVPMFTTTSAISGYIYYTKNGNYYPAPAGTKVKITNYNGIMFADTNIGRIATIASDGTYSISNIPDVGMVRLKVGPVDVDGDNVDDLAAISWTVGLDDDNTVHDTLSLGAVDDASFALTFDTTKDIEDQNDNGLIAVDSDFTISANEKIDTSLFDYVTGTNNLAQTDLYLYYYNLLGEMTYVDLSAGYSFDTTEKVLTVDPGTMVAGERYYLGVDLTSANGDKVSLTTTFTNAGTLSYTLNEPSTATNFSLYMSSSNYTIDANGGTANINWTNKISDIDGWNVYVQWDGDSTWYFDGVVSNKDYYLSDFMHTYSYIVDADPDGDTVNEWQVYQDENTQTPLGLGHSIQLALVPFYITNLWLNDAASTNMAVELTKGSAQQMTIEDKRPPQVINNAITLSGPLFGWDNTGAPNQDVTNEIEIYFSEFVTGNFSSTKITVETNDGIGGYTSVGSSYVASYELGDTRTNAILQVAVPDGVYVGRITFSLNAVTDTSGNTNDQNIVPPLDVTDMEYVLTF